MAKITLTKPKLSSDELDRMLGSETTDAGNENVSATNILDETSRSDTTTDVSATNNPSDEGVSATNTDTFSPVSATNNPSEDDVSATNNSRGQYINQYKKDHYDVLRISLPKGVKAVLQQEAKERNVSVTNMVLQALTQYLGKDVSSTNSE